MSALAELSGMFPNNAPSNAWLKGPKANGTVGYSTNIPSPKTNYLSRLNSSNCDRFKFIKGNLSTSNDSTTVQDYFYNKYGSDLSSSSNITGLNL
jgi:hypothetical protein